MLELRNELGWPTEKKVLLLPAHVLSGDCMGDNYEMFVFWFLCGTVQIATFLKFLDPLLPPQFKQIGKRNT